MTCRECPKVALYQVPQTNHYYCKDHKSKAVEECTKQSMRNERKQ